MIQTPYESVPLGSICELNPKLPKDSKPSDTTPVSFVPMAAVDEQLASVRSVEAREYSAVKKGFTPFRDNDVLFAKITPCMENGKVALVSGLQGGLGFGSTEFHVLRASDRVLPEWLRYFVLRPSFRSAAKKRMTGAVGQQRVPIDFLAKSLIPLPPVGEQRRIVDLLSRAENIVRMRREAEDKAKEIIPALFVEMFGDPSNSAHGGRGGASTEAASVAFLGDICTRLTVGHVGPMISEYQDDGIVWLRSLNIKRNRIDLSEIKYVGNEFHKKLRKSALTPGDVVTVRTGKPGVSAVVPEEMHEANCSDLIVMTCGNGIRPMYLSEFLNQTLGDQEVLSGTTGAVQGHFNIGTARKIPVPVPSLDAQDAFVRQARISQEICSSQSGATATAESAFQSLLAGVFGERGT